MTEIIPYNMSFHIERAPKIAGTSLDVASFTLLISAAAVPFLVLVIIHSILKVRSRRVKARYRPTIFISDRNSSIDAWGGASKGEAQEGDATSSVWLTSNHVQVMEPSPRAVRGGHLPRSDHVTPWGAKFDLEDTINAFFDANSVLMDVSSQDQADWKTEATTHDDATTSGNLLLVASHLADQGHKSFESLCDVVINNMAEPADQHQDERQHRHGNIDLPKESSSRRLPVSEDISMATESSMGEFSVEEEEILRDFDAILSSYCDEESDWTDDWRYMKIKY